MKISIEYTEDSTRDNLRIKSADYLSDYAIRLHFSDGTQRLVDFKPFLTKALHPSVKKYLDESLFSKFALIDGNLNWNDYDLIFPIGDLYKGRIES